jgi:hypothetical protein
MKLSAFSRSADFGMNSEKIINDSLRITFVGCAATCVLAFYFLIRSENKAIGLFLLALTGFLLGLFFLIHAYKGLTDEKNEMYLILVGDDIDPWWSPLKIFAIMLRWMKKTSSFMILAVVCLAVTAYFIHSDIFLITFLILPAEVFAIYVLISTLFYISKFGIIPKNITQRMFRRFVQNPDHKNGSHQALYFTVSTVGLVWDLMFLSLALVFTELAKLLYDLYLK